MDYIMRRKIALCLLAAWILLFAFCFAEQFGYFHDTVEYAGQCIEENLINSSDLAVNNFNEPFTAFAFVGFLCIAILSVLLKPVPLTREALSRIEHTWPPDLPKIFQFTCTYRI